MDGAFPRDPEPMPVPRLPGLPRRQIVPSAVLGMLIFVVAEVMFFAGLMSAFTISRANQLPGNWPPPGQPMLPASSTALNTVLLLLSGVSLLVCNHFVRREKAPAVVKASYLLALALGLAFVGLQGREWQALLAAGLTLSSSTLGSFFYVIVGGHALHAIAALFALLLGVPRALSGRLSGGFFFGVQTFWYFVVLMWPVIYARVYF